MIRVLAAIITGMVFFAACTDQYKVPGDIIPRKKMEKVLWDMLLADRYATVFVAKDSTKNVKEENLKLYEQVFSIHKITRDEFVTSFKYYLKRPDITMAVVDTIAARANRKREDLYKSLEAN